MASRIWVHCPGGTETVEPISFSGPIERIVSGPWELSREAAISDALSCDREISPTLLYEMHNVLVLNGSIYANGHRHAAAPSNKFSGSQAAETIDEAVLASSHYGSEFFGDWLVEDCAQQLLAEILGLGVPIEIARPPYRHEPGYRELFELPAPRQVEWAFIRKLMVISDHGPTFDKTERIAALRARLLRNLGPLPPPQLGVYVDRGVTGTARSLINKDDVIARLLERGFSVITPETMSARQVAATLATAKCVIGVEGSHMAPTVMSMAPGSMAIDLHPANRFFPSRRLYCNAFGIKYGAVICSNRSETEFEADIDEFDIFLDGLLTSSVVSHEEKSAADVMGMASTGKTTNQPQ